MRRKKQIDLLINILLCLSFLLALILLVRIFGEGAKQELTVQDKVIVGNINRALVKTPLSGYGYYFLIYARKYHQDPYLSPAIAIFESSAGKHCVRPYNAFGMKDRSGKWKKYKSFEEAIKDNVARISRIWGRQATSRSLSRGRVRYAENHRKWNKYVEIYRKRMERGGRK